MKAQLHDTQVLSCPLPHYFGNAVKWAQMTPMQGNDNRKNHKDSLYK